MANSELIDDAVSRQAVLDELRTCFDTHSIYDENNGENYIIYEDAVDMMEKLPPVTPTRKVGKWIFTKTIFDKYGCTVECPSCHKKWKTYDEIRWEKENKFCPNCGADMRGGEQ